MSIIEQIGTDYIDAYKSHEELRVSVLRMLKSALKNEEIKNLGQLDESGVIKVIKKEINQRKESVIEYKRAGKDEMVAKEESEITILESYLPKQLSEDEIKTIVQNTIIEISAEGMKDMGKVIGKVMSEHGDSIDGKAVSQVAQELLKNT
jgi:hypothetical protein